MENKTHKIIIFEDDATMLSLLHTLLKMEGFEVVSTQADTLEKMVAAIQAEQPDLALIDVHLHDLNGFDLLDRIRQNNELKEIRVMMSSGMDFRTECLNRGADEFILKPYMPDDLMSLIHRMVGSNAENSEGSEFGYS